jgi:hypothetical protein
VRYVGGVLLDGAEVRIAAAVFRLYVRHLERTEGGARPVLREIRDRLAAFAAETSDTPLASGSTGRVSEGESEVPDIDLWAPDSPMTARDVAELLGISDQAVTARCRAGTLTAVKTRGGWEIDRRSAMAEARKGKLCHRSEHSASGLPSPLSGPTAARAPRTA